MHRTELNSRGLSQCGSVIESRVLKHVICLLQKVGQYAVDPCLVGSITYKTRVP